MEINPQAAIVIGVILYKLTCLIVGLAICFMGYRLFLADVPQSFQLAVQVGTEGLS
jgi:hypothetical protein